MIELIRSISGVRLGFFSLDIRSIHAAAYLLAGSALASALLALLRDRLLAHTFGAGATLDMYYAAFRIPDLLFVCLGALVSAYVLLPLLSGMTHEDQVEFIDTTVSTFSLVAIVVSGAAFFAAPFILRHLFPEIGGELVFITRLLLVQPIVLGLSNIVAAVTQMQRRYALYACAPIVYNLGIIFGIVVLHPRFGISGVAGGVVFGALLHLAIQIPNAVRGGFLTRVAAPRLELFFNTARVSLPRALALSASQIAFLGLTSFAASLPLVSIAIFMFAFNLQAVPLSVIGASYSVAAFPLLTRAFSRGQTAEFMAHVRVAARQIIFWSLPALALIIVLRAHVVRIVLGSGAFDWTDTRLTAAALALFSISLVAQGMTLLLIRSCYAAGKTFAPVFLSALTGALTVLLGRVFLTMFENADTAVFLQVLLRVEDAPGSAVLALALAYTSASLIGALLLAGYVEMRFGDFLTDVKRAWWQGVTACFAAGVAAYLILHLIGEITFATTLGSIFLRGALAGAGGISAALAAYWLVGSRELGEVVAMVRGKLWRGVEAVSSAE